MGALRLVEGGRRRVALVVPLRYTVSVVREGPDVASFAVLLMFSFHLAGSSTTRDSPFFLVASAGHLQRRVFDSATNYVRFLFFLVVHDGSGKVLLLRRLSFFVFLELHPTPSVLVVPGGVNVSGCVCVATTTL